MHFDTLLMLQITIITDEEIVNRGCRMETKTPQVLSSHLYGELCREDCCSARSPASLCKKKSKPVTFFL